MKQTLYAYMLSNEIQAEIVRLGEAKRGEAILYKMFVRLTIYSLM